MEEKEFKEKVDDYMAMMEAINSSTPYYAYKLCLTLEEAARYSGIGVNKMRILCDRHEDLFFWNGSKRLIKRKKLEEYLEKEYSI